MKFIDRLLDRAKDDVPRNIASEMRAGPAEFGRRARRAYKSPFRWLSPVKMGNERQAPRFARRHGRRVLATASPKARTRRERKEAARINALARRGKL